MGIVQEPRFYDRIRTSLFTVTQVLILFWISYNLMRYERIRKGTLWVLAVSCLILAIMQILNITSERVGYGDRVSAFGDNPNQLGWMLSVGLLTLVGLAYGRENVNFKVRLLTWLSFGVLATALIRTGSRGATAGLVAGLMAFLLKGRSFGTKLKIGLIVVLGIGSLIWASYHIEAVRVRWEQTFYKGSMAGREEIYPAAWEMFQEKPLFGWGPVKHYYELGSRLGLPTRDPHNLYLWILIETGLLGAVPFFAGLWLCWHAAWKARHSIQGVVPVALMLCFLVNNAKGTGLADKVSWIILAYALASGSSVPPPWRWRRRVHPANTWPTHWPTSATLPFPGYVTPLNNNLDS